MLKMRLSTEWLLLLGCLWLVAEFVLLGNASVIIDADNGEHFVPGLIGAGFSGAANPLWNNLSAGGIDRIAQGYFGNLDVFLFTNIPGWLAHGARIASLYIAAVLSAYALSRRTFGFGEGASLFVAFTYGVKIHPYLVSSVFAYLPAVILALTYLLERKTDAKRWVLALLTLYFMASTAYFSRLVPFASIVIIAWFIFADTKKKLTDWVIILGGSVVLVALRIGDILALLKQSPLSQMPLVRVQESLESAIEKAFFPPMFFNGHLNIIIFLLLIYALIVRRGGDFRMKLILFGVLLGIALPPLGTAIQLALLDSMPFLYGYSISLVSIVPTVLYIFAAGYGIQTLNENFQGRFSNNLLVWAHRAALAVAVGVLAFASIKYKAASAYNWVTHGSFTKNFDSPVIHELASKIRAQPWPVRVESFQMHPGYLHAYGLETAGGYSPMLLRRYYEFWGKVVELWAADIGPESRYFAPFNKSIKENGGGNGFAANG